MLNPSFRFIKNETKPWCTPRDKPLWLLELGSCALPEWVWPFSSLRVILGAHSQPLRYLDAHMSRAAEGSYTVWGDFVVFEWDLEIPWELGWNSHGGEAEKMRHRHGN